jgi:hypothetical protein
MPSRGYRFVLPMFWKWRDLVERLIGVGVEVSKVSRNRQVLMTVWAKTVLPIRNGLNLF